jgi:hypothetical protein
VNITTEVCEQALVKINMMVDYFKLSFLILRNNMNILGLKLVTGEEIISNVEYTTDGKYKLINCVQLRIVPPQMRGGEPSMGFVPFPALAKISSQNFVEIEPLHVVYSYTPDDSVVENYRAAFSGIVTPSKQLITG